MFHRVSSKILVRKLNVFKKGKGPLSATDREGGSSRASWPGRNSPHTHTHMYTHNNFVRAGQFLHVRGTPPHPKLFEVAPL